MEVVLSCVRDRGGIRRAGRDVTVGVSEAPDVDLVSRDLALPFKERADRDRSDKHTKLGLPSSWLELLLLFMVKRDGDN